MIIDMPNTRTREIAHKSNSCTRSAANRRPAAC